MIIQGGVRDNQEGPYLPVTVELKGQAVQSIHTATPNPKVMLFFRNNCKLINLFHTLSYCGKQNI